MIDFSGKIAVVTGAGQGIGHALALALRDAGASLVICDRDATLADKVAGQVHGMAVTCDVADPVALAEAVSAILATQGRIDIWISNAGFARGEPNGPVSAPDTDWQAAWDLHVMAHVQAARLVLPQMLARGSGILVNVASAAGLLSQIGDAAYSATKSAAISLAQSLAISHADQGIQVAVVCPLYVATPLLGYDDNVPEDRPNDRVITAQEVANATMDGLRSGQFLILTHPEARTYFVRRAKDTDRWVHGMTRLRRSLVESHPTLTLRDLHRLM